MGKIHQVHTAISCSLSSILTGSLYLWPSYTMGLYTANDTKLLATPMADTESSLLGSLPSLGAMLGTALVGIVISNLGRQKGGMLLALPFVLSWLIIDMSSSSLMILIARFVGGIGCGAVLVYAPMFISEVAEESIRGTLASVPMACYCMGLQLSYILGWCLSYRYILWVNLALSILNLAMLMTVTESPVFLMRQNREEDAKMAIAHYRGESPGSKVVLEEMSRLKQLLTPAVEMLPLNTEENTKAEEAEKEKLNVEEDTQDVQTKPSAIKMLYRSPSSRRGFIVVGLLLSVQVMMGLVAVQVYAKQIFSEAAPSLSSHLCSVIFALVILLGSLFSLVATDKFGRKILIIISSSSVALCLSVMGALLQTGVVPAAVPALLILLYCFCFMLGAGSVPYVLMSECFIPDVQSLASTLLMEWVWLLNFFIVAIFPFLIKYFGIHGSFYIFAVFATINTIVGIFLLPETKGLTNDQIQEALMRRNK
ncbi:Facilitated trehalose transporter Tret1-2-like [Papilio xuthus]|uniref:Facilitated trehalose transporter Tret1-2-like n=1 Tax=Papilio xuthus TaxID=66420 RepID=A0A0N0PF14_PAPXU|nr:Facilitated trehalose transporter Tret1-2-like [Papilio xuthus]